MAKRFNPTPLAAKLRDAFFQTSPDLPRIVEVELGKLRSNPDQPRKHFDPRALQELADSIKEHDLIQPIAVARDPENPEGFIIVAGERRFRAFQRLGRETIPAIITTGAPDEISLIENIQREDLHPLEEAEALAKLMEKHHYTHEELSKIIGKARNTVTELLRLNTLAQVIKDECRTSDIPKSVLVELTRVKDPKEQLRLWRAIKERKLTVKAARAHKKGTSARDTKEPTARVLVAGRGFVARLQQIATDHTTLSTDWLAELLELRNQVNELVQRLSTKSGAHRLKAPKNMRRSGEK